MYKERVVSFFPFTSHGKRKLFLFLFLFSFLVFNITFSIMADDSDDISPVGQIEPELVRKKFFLESYRLSTAGNASFIFGSLKQTLPYAFGGILNIDLIGKSGRRLDFRVSYGFSNYTKGDSLLRSHEITIGPLWKIDLFSGRAGAIVVDFLIGVSIYNYVYYLQKGLSTTFFAKASLVYEFSLQSLSSIVGKAFFPFVGFYASYIYDRSYPIYNIGTVIGVGYNFGVYYNKKLKY